MTERELDAGPGRIGDAIRCLLERTAVVIPSPALSFPKHPARGFALVSTPRAGLVSPASTRRCVTDEH
jgi:hypothetical protein